MKIILARVLFAAIIGTSINLFADYPKALPNRDVCKEILANPNSKVPSLDWACATLSSNVFLRMAGINDFYHGFGHWTQLRSEFSINDYTKLNVRSIFYSGSSSNGYAEPTADYHLFSVSAKWPTPVYGGDLSVRVIDQDRLTTGVGLFIQDKESNGGSLKWENDFVKTLIRIESTGAFLLGDDVLNFEVTAPKDVFGIGAISFYSGKVQSSLLENRKPYFYSFLNLKNEEYLMLSEVGHRNKTWAGLIKIGIEKKMETTQFSSAVQYRKYENNFAEDIAGFIDHQYVSYDQYDKPFTNAINFFVEDDGLDVYALDLNIKHRFNDKHGFGFFNELGRAQFEELSRQNYYFYRAEYSYTPFADRDDAFVLFVSNKVLNNSYSRPPYQTSIYDRQPLFKEYSFFGFEGQFRF